MDRRRKGLIHTLFKKGCPVIQAALLLFKPNPVTLFPGPRGRKGQAYHLKYPI